MDKNHNCINLQQNQNIILNIMSFLDKIGGAKGLAILGVSGAVLAGVA